MKKTSESEKNNGTCPKNAEGGQQLTVEDADLFDTSSDFSRRIRTVLENISRTAIRFSVDMAAKRETRRRSCNR